MTWHTIWCHDTLFEVMTNFLTSWCVILLGGEFFVVMDVFHDLLTLSWYFLFHHFGHKILWKTCFLMSLSLWYIIYFMVNVLTSWQNLMSSCHVVDAFFDIIVCFLTSWRTFLTHLLTAWRVFDVIANLSMSWHVLTSWHTVLTYIWCHGQNLLDVHGVFFYVIDVFWCVCDIMTNFLKYVALIDVMTNVLIS